MHRDCLPHVSTLSLEQSAPEKSSIGAGGSMSPADMLPTSDLRLPTRIRDSIRHLFNNNRVRTFPIDKSYAEEW